MAPLTRQVNTTNKFLLQELPEAIRSDSETILVQAARSTGVVAPYTLMGKAAVSGKWIVPYNPAAVDGSAVVLGVYIGPEIAEATIKAGDINNASILLFGAKCDEAKLTVEGATTLETVVTGSSLAFSAGTGDATAVLTNTFIKRVRDMLIDRSLFFMTTEQVNDTY